MPKKAPKAAPKNKLYYGDNLDVMRAHIKDESIDIIYLDPPFNSKRSYSAIFKSPEDNSESDAQIVAFEDTWHWGQKAEEEYQQIIDLAPSEVVDVMQSLRAFLGENDMMAYLTMMANRLLQMHRILKQDGKIFLHCDPTASHYLKIVMDSIFGKTNFKNEIIWHYKRWPTKSSHLQRMHDVILFYAKDADICEINTVYQSPSASTLKRWGNSKQVASFSEDGKRNPNTESGKASEGTPLDDVWDIPVIAPVSHERLGYPTQKPLALLDRILAISESEDCVVLDPFCGCGTALHASEKRKLNWIGIDITHLAVNLIENRIKTAFPKAEFEVIGTPKDIAGAVDLAKRDKYQFQWWASALIGAQPYQGKKKGADGGIDAIKYFTDEKGPAKKILVSVKGGANVDVKMIREFENVIRSNGAEIGIFITLSKPTKPMVTEAAKAGFYHSKRFAKNYPRVQIMTIEELMNSSKPDFPDLSAGTLNAKPAQREQEEAAGLFD